MKFFQKLIVTICLVLTIIVSGIFLASAQDLIDYPYSFGDTGVECGFQPTSSLIYVESEQKLYGMTTRGGINNLGVVFAYDPYGATCSILHEFNTPEGVLPTGSLIYVESEQKLYGTTTAGGASDQGTIFSLRVDGTEYVTVKDFTVAEGSNPKTSLTYVESEQKLYGTTSTGGTNATGVIFSYTLSDGTYTVLHNFDSGIDIIGSLTYLENENSLYGMATKGGPDDNGVIFRFNLTQSIYETAYSFGNKVEGTAPFGALTAVGKTLYGRTRSEGEFGFGVIFSIRGEQYTVLHNFETANDADFNSALLFDGVRKVYGTTSVGGANNAGVLFSYDLADNTYSVRDVLSTGIRPVGSLAMLSQSLLYGMTFEGGVKATGTIFNFTFLDIYPDPFSFDSVENIPKKTTIKSNAITVDGLSPGVSAAITLSECYAGDCGYLVNGEIDVPTVSNGDSVQITLTALDCDESYSPVITIEGVQASFDVKTEVCSSGGGDPDTEAPTVSFTMPSSGSNLTVSVAFDALDNTGTTGYMLTESATPPEASDERWQGSAPASYTFSTYGSYTLYAWAKDAAGNVSAETSQSITLTDPTPPPPDPEPEPEPEPDDEDAGGGGGRSSSGSNIAGAGLVGVQPSTPSAPQTVVEVVPVAPAPVVDTPRPRPESTIVLDSPIKQFIKREFTPAQVEIIEVSIKAIIATVTAIGGAIVLASVLFLNPLARPEFILIPLRLWALLLAALGIRKKPVPWGTVYDAITKQPVDPVRVSLIDIDGNVVETSITDSSGRYGFIAKPGIYKIVLSKTNYLFPSHVIAQKNMRDELYEKPYFGDYLPYDPAIPIEKNIPIDPLDFDTAAFAKNNGDLSVHYSRREEIAERLFNTLFFTTFAVVVASLIIYPQMYNVIIFLLYIAAFIFRRQAKRAKHMGRIYDLYGKPLAHVTMKVHSAVDNSLIKTITTTRAGRYYLHLPQGLYYVRVERTGPDGLSVPVYSSPEILMVRHGILNKVFSIAYS